MYFAALISSLLFCSSAANAASLLPRQSACFLPGKVALSAELIPTVAPLAAKVTCGTDTTIDNVLDVTSGGISFSSINFAASKQTPLAFSLATFTSDDQTVLQNQVNVYQATELGIRSEGGNLAIKVPTFFLQFKLAIANQAAGEKLSGAGTVAHQLGKVLKNAAGESQALLDQVQALGTAAGA